MIIVRIFRRPQKAKLVAALLLSSLLYAENGAPPPPPVCTVRSQVVDCEHPCKAFPDGKYSVQMAGINLSERTELQCQSHVRNGKASAYSNGEMKWSGEFADDLTEGIGLYCSKGKVDSKYFYRKGKPQWADLFFPDGRLQGYRHVVQHRVYTPDGKETEVFTSDGHSINGKVRENHVFAQGYMVYELKNGVRDGPYHEVGSNYTRDALFKNGKLDGEQVVKDHSGKILSREMFKDGVLVGKSTTPQTNRSPGHQMPEYNE